MAKKKRKNKFSKGYNVTAQELKDKIHRYAQFIKEADCPKGIPMLLELARGQLAGGQYSGSATVLKNRAKTKQPSPQQDFYLTREWRELRYEVLRRNDGRCELCGRSKHDGIVLHVDHIKPRSKYPKLQMDVKNLQILCADCNIGKSNKDDTDWQQHAKN